jgi:hypothetical protein
MTSAIVSYSGHVQTPYPFGRDYAFMVNTYEKNDARGVIVNLQSGSVAELVGGYSVAGLNLATTMDGRAITLSGTPGGGTNPVWSMAFTEKFNDVTQTVSATGFAGCRAGV